MANEIITAVAIGRRNRWLDKILKISGSFDGDVDRIVGELSNDLENDGYAAILDHLRLAGAIPEYYDHDSSAEKLYSKYTDALLSISFKHIGLQSIVLSGRGDCADVEAECPSYSLVADAKAFRLSRTAKNQKDFKVEAMDRWKRQNPFAMVVCPIYQLPHRTSQIYQQATTRKVCIFTYSHLAVLVRLAEVTSQDIAMKALHSILVSTENLIPTKEAKPYWQQINTAMLKSAPCISEFWRAEKIATLEAIDILKEEAKRALASERKRILTMSHSEAIDALIKDKNIVGRTKTVNNVSDRGLLEIL